MAKGALATSALTLGTGTFGTATVGAQQDEVAIFARHFYPGTNFRVIETLQTNMTVEILQVDEETVPEISQPDEWVGHLIRYDIGGNQDAGIVTFLFVRGQRLDADHSGTIDQDASVFNSDLNLLSVSTTEGEEDDVVEAVEEVNQTATDETFGEDDVTVTVGGDEE